MPPTPSFSVSEVRAAATCPRIAYFDAEHARRRPGRGGRSATRLWKAGDGGSACGSLFHNAVESFNRRALDAPEVRDALAGDPDPRSIERRLRVFLNGHCVDLDALAARPPARQQAFARAVGVYMGELADIVGDALARGKPADEILHQLFGDRRRRVDVTFRVGPGGEPVRVAGVLDYVFYDWRTAHHRVIDYKLTPGGDPGNDLFQVALYALMHDVLHHTEPDAAVLYLHPERRMVEMTWDQVRGRRRQLFDLLASMAGWVRYDEAGGSGLKPPGEPAYCPLCRWDRDGGCARRLGPKSEGRRLRHWSDAEAGGRVPGEPAAEVREPDGPTRPWADADPAPGADDDPPRESEADLLHLGAAADGGGPVDMPLAALCTHVAVVGAAGGGKTWTAKVLAEEAVRLGVPVLALDPQGDLVQFLRPAPEPAGLSPAARALRRGFLDRVEPRVWTPGSSHANRLSLDPIRLTGRGDLAAIADPDRRDEEWQGMLAVAAAQLVGLARAGGETDSQQTFLLRVLRSLAEKGGRDVDLGAVADAVSAPEDPADADRYIWKAEREKLARKLNGLRVGPAAGLYAGGRPLDLDAMSRADSPGKTPLNVVYLNALAGDDQKQFFAAALAAEVYRWMVTTTQAEPGRPRLLFYLDEARDYVPAGSSKPPAKEPLIRLFTQGRKFGVACLVCTQSPRSVDHNVFGNCSTKLVGRLESAQDLDRVGEWFAAEGAVPPWLSGRKGAAAGSFVGRWPGIPADFEGRAFRSRALHSLHEAAWSPDRLERETAADRTAGRRINPDD